MKSVLALTMLLLLSAVVQAQTNPAFTAVPAMHSVSQNIPFQSQASQDIRTLQRAGIVIGYPEGTYSGPPLHTHQQFADALGRLLAQTFPSAEAAAQGRANRESVQIKNTLSLNLPALAALTQLVGQFAPELTAKGFHVPAIQKELMSFAAGRPLTVAPRFVDVPRSHWAYSSVEALRKAGLIIGEGGRQFH